MVWRSRPRVLDWNRYSVEQWPGLPPGKMDENRRILAWWATHPQTQTQKQRRRDRHNQKSSHVRFLVLFKILVTWILVCQFDNRFKNFGSWNHIAPNGRWVGHYSKWWWHTSTDTCMCHHKYVNLKTYVGTKHRFPTHCLSFEKSNSA